jgi:hypothetical protein
MLRLVKDATAEAVLSEIAEETLHHVTPRNEHLRATPAPRVITRDISSCSDSGHRRNSEILPRTLRCRGTTGSRRRTTGSEFSGCTPRTRHRVSSHRIGNRARADGAVSLRRVLAQRRSAGRKTACTGKEMEGSRARNRAGRNGPFRFRSKHPDPDWGATLFRA